MDPNLVKIQRHNMRLIRKGKIRLPMLQAKHYLTYILTEYQQDRIDAELIEFEAHLKTLKREKKHAQEEGNRKAQAKQRTPAPTQG
jgi:ABC-type phosphate transport system auxiliary subunit